MVIIDDVHWAEPALLDLVDYVVAFSSGAPILLVCLGRPEVLARRPGWAAPQRGASVVALDALADGDALALVEALGMERGGRPPIVERAEGNPLFLEQLVAIGGDALPPTIEAVLAARLEGLEAEERACSSTPRSRAAASTAAPSRPCSAGDALGRPLMALARGQLIRPTCPSTPARTPSASATR